MSGTLEEVHGWERDLANLVSGASIDTSVFDSAFGGLASLAINEASANTEYRIVISGAFSSLRKGIAFRFRRPNATPGAPYIIAMIDHLNGTTPVERINLVMETDFTLRWYVNATSPFNGPGTPQGSAGAHPIPAETWVTLWIDADTQVGALNFGVHLDHRLETSCTLAPSAATTWRFYLGGRTGASAPAYTCNFDNTVIATGIDGSEGGGYEWLRGVTAPLPNGAGSHQDFSVSGAASHWQAVDEVAQNGDTDYVAKADAKTAGEETENMSDPARSSPFVVADKLDVYIVHRNADGGKWAGVKVIRKIVQGVASSGPAIGDPGASYARSRFGLSSVTDADLADFEAGAAVTTPDASDEAEWRITAIAAMAVFKRVGHLDKVRGRGMARGVMRGCR